MAHTRTTTGLLLLPCGLWVDDIEWFGGGGVCRRQPARPPSPSPPEPPPPSPVAEPLPTSRTPAPTRDTQPALLLLLFCLVFLPALSLSHAHTLSPQKPKQPLTSNTTPARALPRTRTSRGRGGLTGQRRAQRSRRRRHTTGGVPSTTAAAPTIVTRADRRRQSQAAALWHVLFWDTLRRG